MGYSKVRRYAGGIIIFDWDQAGYPLEGDLVS
jgi:hypothetical protein